MIPRLNNSENSKVRYDFKYHVNVGFGFPEAETSNFAFCPSRTSLSVGFRVNVGCSCRSKNIEYLKI